MTLLPEAPHVRTTLDGDRLRAESINGQPVVSVCIVNWNCRDLLRDCLTSLLDRAQGVAFEVIVVDNASTDGAPEMVAAAFPGVRLVRNPANLGFSRANNQAAAIARGRYFFFLNNDTVVPPGTLARLAAFAHAHPDVGMIGPRLLGGDGVPQISYRRTPTFAALLHRLSILRWTGLFRRAYSNYRRGTYDPAGVKRVERLMGAAVFVTRSAFERSGRWDESYRFGGEDLDLSAQVNRQYRVVYHGDVTVVHYGRASSKTNSEFVVGSVETGYVVYLRKAGTNAMILTFYKALVTLDAPVQFVLRCGQTWFRTLRSRQADAAKSRESARGLWHFLSRGMPAFWRA